MQSESKNYEKLNDKYIKQNGYDAEQFKAEYVGVHKGGSYDMFIDKDTKEIILIDKWHRNTVHTNEKFTKQKDYVMQN